MHMMQKIRLSQRVESEARVVEIGAVAIKASPNIFDFYFIEAADHSHSFKHSTRC